MAWGDPAGLSRRLQFGRFFKTLHKSGVRVRLHVQAANSTNRPTAMPADDWVRETYENHRGLLFRVAWLILRQTDLAEDAVHTAFSRIVRRRPQLNGNAKGYVLQAVRNAAIDIRRRRTRRRTETIASWESVAGQDEATRVSERDVAVAAAMEQLDETTREIILLHVHEEMTFREIGELIGAPLPTVASRYRRGLKQIRSEVNPDDGPD